MGNFNNCCRGYSLKINFSDGKQFVRCGNPSCSRNVVGEAKSGEPHIALGDFNLKVNEAHKASGASE